MRDSPSEVSSHSLIKTLIPVFLVVASDIIGLTIMIPFLPFYAQKFGASPEMVGALLATYALCQLFAGPLLGAWSDRSGRRPVLILSQIGTFIGLIILARADALWMVFLSRIIDGVTAGNITVAQAYIADVTKPEDRAKAFAVIGISFGLGFFLGPAISGFLSHYGPAVPIYGAAGFSALSILGSWILLKEPEKHVEIAERRLGVSRWGRYAEMFQEKETGRHLVQFFCFVFAFSIFFSGFPLFAPRRLTWGGEPIGVREVALFYSYSGFLGILIQGRLVGIWAKRHGESKMVLWGFVAASFGYAVLAGTFSIGVLMVSASVMALGTGILRPALTSLISRSASRDQQGMVLGLTQSLNSVSQILGPLIAGFLIGNGQLSTWALIAAAFSVLGLALSVRPSGKALES